MAADRRRARRNLACIYKGQWSRRRIYLASWRIYAELGKNAFDAFYLARRGREALQYIVRHDSFDEFRAAYDEGKGVIAITAHLGCFEMLLHLWAAQGFSCFALGRKLFDPRIDAIISGLRSGPNILYIDRDESVRRIIGLLAEGRVMGVLIDQDTRVDGVFAHFLGRLAWTPSGPLRLAMRFNIPVFVATTARQPDNTHYVSISRRLELENTGDRDRDLAMNVEKVNDIISAAILRDPAQWVWMHERWRRRPDEPGMKNSVNIEKYGIGR